MGRHSCCVKQKLRKGLWSPEEDEKLFNHITRFGVGCWSSVPKLAGLQRCGKSCRLRWINYLRPDLKRGMFSQQEEDIILSLHEVLGNRWAQIAAQLPGRTDNEIKNFWNSCLKKKLMKQGIDPATHKPFIQQPQIKQEILNNNGLETAPPPPPPEPLSLQNMHFFSQGPPFMISDSSYYDAAALTEAAASRDEILMSMSNIKPHEWVVDPALSYYDSLSSHHHQFGTSSSSCYGMICSSMPSLTSSDQNNLSAMTEFSDNNNSGGSKISSSNNSSNMSSYVVENNNNNNNGRMVSWEGSEKFQFQEQVNGVKSEEVVVGMNNTSSCSWQETVHQLQNHSSTDFNSYPLTSFSQDLTAATYDVFRHI